MEKRWILVVENYNGVKKNAVNMLYSVLSSHLNYVLPVRFSQSVTEKELCENNVIVVGEKDNEIIKKCAEQNVIKMPTQKEGYSACVGESVFEKDAQMIIIAGYDDAGVLYGCMDFCNSYLGDVVYREKDLWTTPTYDKIFENKLNSWSVNTAPAIKRRALWTWGHVIYDYRKFFENMAKLRLNEVIIWNDVAPINAKDVVDYAHSLNIKVIWGYAWGWDTSCNNVLKSYDKDTLAKIKQRVLKTYEDEYREAGGDGIYFQSFTESEDFSVDGKCIAELVTELVNDIAGELLSKYPSLHLQFGLHATSVRNRLEYIKNVDKRIHIVWEDCGSFPYDYFADKVGNFDETLELTKKILELRGEEEKWGAVFKGMLKLDWLQFEHFSAPYIFGERSEQYINERQTEKNRIWKIQQASWLKNAEYVRRTVKVVADSGKDTIVQALVEDGMFENEIMFPVALYAEMLWNSDEPSADAITRVSKYPCVNYGNL